MSAAGAIAAAAAAAARRRKEEESMAVYTPTDLADGWEFKILRSATRLFRDPARMRAALDEEARAGWTFLEKFDDQRLRLKRPASAKAGDSALDFDPYRTQIGISDVRLGLTIMVCVLGGVAAVLAIIILLTRAAHP
jgi:hypothetical protein